MDKNVERLSDNIYGKKSKGATYETITPAMRAAAKKREDRFDNMLDQMAATIPSKKKGGRRSRKGRSTRRRNKRSTRRRR